MSAAIASRDKLKRNIIKHSQAVKRKFIALKQGQLSSQHVLGEAFQPITTPLHKLINEMQNMKKYADDGGKKMDYIKKNVKEEEEGEEKEEEEEKHNPIVSMHIHNLSKRTKHKAYDKVYGVQYSNNKLMIGNTPIKFDKDHVIVNNIRYKGTSGLYNLLFLNNPPDGSYDDQDIYKYKDILISTNAHRVDYDPKQKLRRANTKKYYDIIVPLFQKRGGSWKVSLPNHKIEYKHWDDPNELVERLDLLISSRYAGNTGVNNEIYAIEEELREGGYIE